MLTSASTDNSVTQNELLNALGRTRNIEELSRNYQDILEDYEVRGKGNYSPKYVYYLYTNLI